MKILETDTNPAILYNYSKPLAREGTYDPSVNVGIDKTKEQEEDFLANLKELVDESDEGLENDLESSDELEKDNAFGKVKSKDNDELIQKLNKEAERVAKEAEKKSKKLESVLDTLCDGRSTIKESVAELQKKE